jgi:hypothetical protein
VTIRPQTDLESAANMISNALADDERFPSMDDFIART